MAALDVVVRGAEIVDGTGAARERRDVGIADGRIVALGAVTPDPGTTVIDAAGQIVAPGFIDVHTHLDVQGFWDPTLSPSPLHGVTTAFGGNCGFSVAPMDEASADYLMRMLARVEGMPLVSLREGVPWNWSTTAEFLSKLDGILSINTAFMVGHSALRRVVMGEAATQGTATEDQITAMAELLRAGIRAGGLGFSSSWGAGHFDGDGVPVPSNHAPTEELVQLASVCREFEGTSLEFIPNGMQPFDERTIDAMASMSAAARRSLNWNVLRPGQVSMETCLHNLGASDVARARGGHVVALAIPFFGSLRFTFHSGIGLDGLTGWADVMALPVDEKLRVLQQPERRRELERLADEPSRVRHLLSDDWGKHYFFDTHTTETKRFEGRYVRDVAAELGTSNFETLLDVCCADGLRTGFGLVEQQQSREDLERCRSIWRDERTIIGGSDAGAHIDMVPTFNLSTTFLEQVLRLDLLSLEEAVQCLTQEPARLYGLHDRGVLRVGARADLVIFDPDGIGTQPTEMRFDLPAGAGRLYAGATGISQVLVNGTPIVVDGEFTDARPGTVLRSGIDTRTAFPDPS